MGMFQFFWDGLLLTSTTTNALSFGLAVYVVAIVEPDSINDRGVFSVVYLRKVGGY